MQQPSRSISPLGKCLSLLIIPLFLLLEVASSQACSSFSARTRFLTMLAKNYDWSFGHGLILTNARNLEKTALLRTASKPVRWRSKYGSITFNQFGKELPNGGINEKGLAIEVLWLNQSVVPAANSLPAINEAQWIQYQLDVSSNIGELIENAKKVRIETLLAKVHYFACDATGDCASIENINGNLVIHTGADMPAQALTNSSYEDSMSALSAYSGFGGGKTMPSQSYYSKTRFIRLAMQSQGPNRKISEERPIDSAFALLKDVSAVGDATRWSIVYELENGIVHFKRFDIGSPAEKILQMKNLNFSCLSPSKMFNLDLPKSGEINSYLVNYTKQENDRIVEASGTNMDAPQRLIDAAKMLPSSVKCME